MTLRIGSLCSGYEGLGMAVQSVLGGEIAWVADNDPGAAKILAHRYPDVPNLGDITAADWSAVQPVDILTAGFPCQDVSCAGARKGLRAGNRTGVWAYVAQAINALRSPLVVLENVRGLLSAGADSPVEPCPWCLGDQDIEHALRALGAVLGDLADLGYDAEWATVSAADAGAPHRRERVFIVARPATDAADGGRDAFNDGGEPRTHGPQSLSRRTSLEGDDRGGCLAAEDSDGAAGGERRIAGPGEAEGGRPWADAGRSGGASALADANGERLRTHGRTAHGDAEVDRPYDAEPDRGRSPVAADATGDGRNERRTESARIVGGSDAAVSGDAVAPDADGGGRGPAEPHDAARQSDIGGIAAVHAESIGRRVGGGRERQGREGQQRGLGPAERGAGDRIDWGTYAPAIRRWEAVTGRPAPRPTEPGRTGERLSPRFVEWMMGLPEGWVTDVPGLSRNAQLKALGNGVVPQQGALALRMLLSRMPVAAEVAA